MFPILIQFSVGVHSACDPFRDLASRDHLVGGENARDRLPYVGFSVLIDMCVIVCWIYMRSFFCVDSMDRL